MTATKTVNYTPEQVQELVTEYQAGTTVEALAERFGKTTRSIVAKLSREGVYESKAKVAQAKRMPKDLLVAGIAERCGVSEEVVDSLEKATAVALTAVLEALMRNEKAE